MFDQCSLTSMRKSAYISICIYTDQSIVTNGSKKHFDPLSHVDTYLLQLKQSSFENIVTKVEHAQQTS